MYLVWFGPGFQVRRFLSTEKHTEFYIISPVPWPDFTKEKNWSKALSKHIIIETEKIRAGKDE